MRYIVTLLLCMFASVGLWAQGVTTASINGTVKDDNGNPLVGANVVAVHEPSGTRYGASTRDDGRYNLPGLRVGGPYTITASYIGYQDQTVKEIYLSLREDRRVDFTLSETALAGEAVTVVAERDAILSAANTGTVNNVTTVEIERLPTITRSITDFTRLAPMAATGIGGTGGTSVAGKSNRYNNFQVDGAVLMDPFGLSGEGNSEGGRFPTSQVGAQPISLDAIQEFNVEIAPYDVRSGSFAGGLINAVTRSGTNRFTGSAYFFGQNESFVGDLVDEVTGESQEFADFDDFQAGFRLGGPIVRDKVFFFVNGEIHRRDQPTSAGLLDSNQPIKFGITSSQMQEIINIAKNQYGYDPGGFDPFTLETNDDKIFARLDINLSNQHRLTLRHNFVNGDIDDGIDRGTDVFTLESNQFKRDNTTNSTVLQLNSLFGSRVANEARIAYTRIRDKRTPPGSPFPEVQINLEDTSGAEIGELRFGWERFSHANRLDQDVWEFTDNLHFFTGDHTITLGTHNELIQFDNLFMEAAFGAYEFASVEDFQRGRPTDFFLSVSRIPGVDRPSAKWYYLQLGFYVQDEWKATPRLNLTGGLRVDVPVISDEPLRNPTFEQDFPGFRTDQTPSGNIMWSPRFGFNYDLTGDRTTQIRGGVGLFAGLPPAVWLSNAFSNTGMDFLTIELSTFAGDSVPNFSPDPFNQPFVSPGTQPPANIALLDEDFKLPQVLRSNLAVDHQLSEGFVGTVEFLYARNINEVLFQNLNIGDFGRPVGTTPDGRPDYGGLRPSDNFASVILLTNTNEGRQINLMARIRKQLGRGPLPDLFGSIAYNFMDAEDVNSGRSSRAISNWRFNETFDPNGENTATSDFEVRHRIVGDLSYQLRYGPGFATTISVFYEGRSGSPFSYLVRADVNGDGFRDNELAFIPAGANDIANPDNWPAIEAFINSDEALKEARGQIFPRNSARAPWRHRLDLRVAQKIPSVKLQNFEVTLDVLNFLNLLNDDWGQVKFVRFDAANLFNFNGYDANGKPDLSLRVRDSNEDGKIDREDVFQVSDLASRWQIQLGIRYSF